MNKQIAVLVLSTAIIAVTCYEFNDPTFNQLLVDASEDFYSSIDEDLGHPRQRRDEEAVTIEKCKQQYRKKKLCCAEETFDVVYEKDKEIRKECFKKIFNKEKDNHKDYDPMKCERIEKHKKDMGCVIQCLGQKKDVLDDDGNVKEDVFSEYVKATMSKESWFGSIQDKVISTCLAEAKNATANRVVTSDSESCNPAGVKLVHCLFREIQLGCPDDQIKDQKACTRARDKIKRHHDVFMPPSPPQNFMNDE